MLLVILSLFYSVLAHEDGPPHGHPELTPTIIATESAQITSPTPAPPTATPTPDLIKQYSSDYEFAKNTYSKAFLDYTDKKQVHTQYGTIVTQKQKLEATRAAIIARNNLLRTYLLTLRVKLDTYQISDPTETEKNKIELAKWEAWLLEQASVVNSLLTDQDIKNNALTFKEKYPQIQQAMYAAVVQNQSNANKYIQSQITPLLDELSKANLKPEGQQLLSEIRIKLDLANQSMSLAIQESKPNPNMPNRFNDFYPSAKSKLLTANGYLQEILENTEGIVLQYLQTP